VADVRGEGLMQAIALNAPLTAGVFTEALLEHGVIGRALGYANTVAFSPPLMISDEEVDELIAATRTVLDELG
jgi:4-aminobutyrate aminotransferase-like enzyme